MRTAELRTPLLTFALLVPIVHFTLTAWIYHGDPLERPRRLVAFVAMLFLLALARLQEALLERYSVQLERGVERARERLADAERLEAVGRLAGGVAHEFNNKLAVILGCQEELALATRGRPELAESLDAIRRAAEHATSLTSKLLAVGRRRMVRPEPIDIDDALEELTPPLRHALGTGIALEVRALPRPALARVDRGGLESALLNLAANAAEATGGSGRVTLSPSVIDLGLEEIPPLSAVAPGRFVRIEMGDDGPGASEEVVARLFEPFFTTHPFGSGRGLGLASVRGIVEQCGGFVTVDTSPGNGFRCRMHFPVASPSSSPSRALSLNPEA
jgi:signal transduction histidine kinase